MVLGLLGLYVILESPERDFVYLMFVFRWNVWLCVKKAEFFSAFFELFQKVMQNPIEISQKHGFWIQACKSAKKIEIGTNDLSKSCPGSVQEDKSLLVGSSCPSLLFLRDGHLSDSVLNQINICKANIKVVHRICILGYKIRILTWYLEWSLVVENILAGWFCRSYFQDFCSGCTHAYVYISVRFL